MIDLAIAPHPLADYKPFEAPIYNWEDWLRAWNNTPHLMARMGLLHGAFDRPVLDWDDSICFLLRMADGWAIRDLERNADPKTRLIRKAAEVLSKHFFGTQFPSGDPASVWGAALESEEVLRHLAWFFRPDPGSISPGTNVCNLPHSSEKGLVPANIRDFARKLAQLAWRFKQEKWVGYHSMPYPLRDTLPDLQADVLHVMLAFGDLELLLHRDCKVDVASRMRLHEIALDRRYVLSWEQWRMPENQDPWSCLQEAAHNGSRAARVALLLGMDDEYSAGYILR